MGGIPLNPEIDGDIGGDANYGNVCVNRHYTNKTPRTESGIRVERGDEEGAGWDSAGLLTNCEDPSDGWGRLGWVISAGDLEFSCHNLVRTQNTGTHTEHDCRPDLRNRLAGVHVYNYCLD